MMEALTTWMTAHPMMVALFWAVFTAVVNTVSEKSDPSGPWAHLAELLKALGVEPGRAMGAVKGLMGKGSDDAKP